MSDNGARARMTLYRPVVVYEYEAGGRRFRGDRIQVDAASHR
jgi:hypothetical protein